MTTEVTDVLLQGCRVLVVEDEYFIADDLAAALVAAGAEVVGPAPTVDAALALLERQRVDCAVLDVNLRGQMAFPLADELRRWGVPFVFATGYDASVVPAQYRDVARWQKPFDIGDLMRALPAATASGG